MNWPGTRHRSGDSDSSARMMDGPGSGATQFRHWSERARVARRHSRNGAALGPAGVSRSCITCRSRMFLLRYCGVAVVSRASKFTAGSRSETDRAGFTAAISGCKWDLESIFRLITPPAVRSKAAMTAWRVDGTHHKVQTAGRNEVFSDYRLRVAQVVREESPGKSAWLPERLNTWNDPAARAPRYMVVADTSGSMDALDGAAAERFESIYRPGKFAQVAEVSSLAQGLALGETCRSIGPIDTFRVCEIERDYGMYERAEAPQFYAPAVVRSTT